MSMDMSEVRNIAVNLGKAGERARSLVKIAVAKTELDMVTDGQILAPVDTGFLQGSIGADRDPDGLGFVAGPTAEYGDYVELGTTKMAAQPFMGPAFDRHITAFEDAVTAAGVNGI